MHMPPTPTETGVHKRRGLRGIALLILGMTLAACGQTAPGQPAATKPDQNVQAAKASVLEATTPVTFTFDQKLDGVDKLKGMKALFITRTREVSFAQRIETGAREALAVAGMTMTPVEFGADLDLANRQIREAVKDGIDVIISDAVSTSLIKDGLAVAHAAGIPTIQMLETAPQLPTPEQAAVGITGQVTFDFEGIVNRLADYVVATSEGDATVIGIGGGADIGPSVMELNAMRARLTETCPKCTFTTRDVPVVTWADKLVPETMAALAAEPDADFVFPVFDPMTEPVATAVREAGKESEIDLLIWGGGDVPMKMLQDNDLVSVDIAGSAVWAGWAAADLAFRALLGAPPVADVELGYRMLTQDNIDEVDLTQPEERWLGDVDFRAEYRQLWGT